MESAVFRYGAILHAWCLMTNHYHLLLETQRGNLSQIMRHINGAYTNYYNARKKMRGAPYIIFPHIIFSKFKKTSGVFLAFLGGK